MCLGSASADTREMTSRAATASSRGTTLGITNTRLNAARRGIAVELATRLAATTGAPVCLVGADPADHDVQRRLPQLLAGEAASRGFELTRGPRSLAVTNLAAHHLCVVSATDRVALDAALPELREIFGTVVIDAPSGVGGGVGIARDLLRSLDMLLVASGLRADELIETRRYLERLGEAPSIDEVDVGVILSGDASDSQLARDQLALRIASLPVVGCVPRLWGRAAQARTEELLEELDGAFAPVIEWISKRCANR